MTTTSDDMPERVFADPELSHVAKVLQQKLERLNAEGLDVCAPEAVESIAWLLAEQVVEFFHVRLREGKRLLGQ